MFEAFEAIDPQAKTGFEGAGSIANGDDLDLIVRNVNFWSPYPGTADEVLRSIAPREMPRANWMGYTKDATSLLKEYWRMVTARIGRRVVVDVGVHRRVPRLDRPRSAAVPGGQGNPRRHPDHA